jgi:hypothetical protein
MTPLQRALGSSYRDDFMSRRERAHAAVDGDDQTWTCGSDAVLTHRFSLESIGDGYRLFGERLDGVLKVAITP